MKKNISIPFVNAHTHAAMVYFRGRAEDLPLKEWLEEHIWPMEKEHVKSDFVYEQTKLAIQEMKNNGIRAFADMYFFEEEVAKACEETKTYVLLGETVMDFATASSPTPQDALKQTQKLWEKYKNNEYVKISVAPHAIYTVGSNTLLESKEFAKKHDLIFHIHLTESKYEFDECIKNHGKTPVKYLHDLGLLDSKALLAHCVWLTDEDIDILAQTGSNVAHCPLSNLKLGSGMMPLDKLLKKGVNVCLGTDGAASSNRLDIREAGKISALLQKGLTGNPACVTTKQVMEMMSVNGMKTLGIKEIDGKSIQDIQRIIDSEDFGYLYHLNVSDLNFI